jgi:hypothetical protein
MKLSVAMRRVAVLLGALLCALLPTVARAASPAAVPAQAASGQASGTITAIGGSWITIQTAGRQTGVVNALVAAANAITQGDYPYVWGGGHPEAGVASALAGAKGRAARQVGFDCSGAVAADLAGAGLWPAGGPVPNDAGVISQLLQQKLIARGPGASPVEVTLYDHPGVHIFMNIDGRFFGTSDGGGGGSAKGGPGWLSDGAPDAFNRAFKQYHVLSSVLKDRTSYGHTLTFQADPTIIEGAGLGDKVTVTYAPGGSGTLTATGLAYAGAVTTSGIVAAIAADGSAFTLQTPAGTTLTLTPGYPGLIDALAAGDTIQVTYTTNAAGALVARALTVTASAPATPGAPTGTGPAGAGGPPGTGAPDGSQTGADGSGAGGGYGNGSGDGSGANNGSGYGNSGSGYGSSYGGGPSGGYGGYTGS